MVGDTMIVVNLDVLAAVLAVLVCAVTVLLRVVWGMHDRHKQVLRDLHAVMDERDLLWRFYEAARKAPVGTGVCCCGDSMDKHPDPYSSGHNPTDEWDNFLSNWKQKIDDCIA